MKTRLLLVVLISSIIAFGCNSGKVEPSKSSKDSLALVKTPENKMMITAKIFLKKEKVTDFIKVARGMIDSTMKEPGCESYMLYQNPYEPSKLIFVESYKNQAAIDAHFASSYFKAFGPVIKDWLTEPTDLKIITVAAEK